MSYSANNFPVPFEMETLDGRVGLYVMDDNFNALSSHLANVANLVHGGGSSTNAAIIISETPPENLVDGLLWWNSTHGVLKVLYNSGETRQWVDATKASGGGLSEASLTYIHGVIATAQGAVASDLMQMNTNYTTLLGTVQGVQSTVVSKASITQLNQAISDASQAMTINYQNYVSNYVIQHPSSQGTIVDLSSYASITYVNDTIATAQGASAEQYNHLQAQYTTVMGTVQGVQTIVSSKASITQLNQAIADASQATAQQYNNLSAQFTSAQGTLGNVQNVVSSKATISEALTAVAGAGYASASTLSTLQSTVAGQTTTVSILASSVDGIKGRYGVTIDGNGSVSGFQLLSGVGGASEFSVTADKFKINKTGAAQALTVFDVNTTTNKVTMTANVDISGSLSITAPQVSSAINGGSTTGARIEMDATNGGRIKIFDTGGNIRVQLGYLG